MLYELIGLVRITNSNAPKLEAKRIVFHNRETDYSKQRCGEDIVPMGIRYLPKIMKKDQEKHFRAYHFLMLFDSSAAVQSEILRTLKKDPRVIRSSIVKVDLDKQLDRASSLHRSLGKKSILELVNEDYQSI